jgi:predicted glycoside hydrolase/deacetylase ChbG (UPF0249 family)
MSHPAPRDGHQSIGHSNSLSTPEHPLTEGVGSQPGPRLDAPVRLVIVNADDFGISMGRNTGVLEAFLGGAITSASILVNSPHSGSAAELARRHGIPAGLHVNITEGFPLSADVPSLVGVDGRLLGKHGIRAALDLGIVDVAHVALEIGAQYAWFLANVGGMPTHLDSHQHVHAIPALVGVFVAACVRWGISRARVAHEPSLPESHWISPGHGVFLAEVSAQSMESRAAYVRADIASTSHFAGLSLMGAYGTEERLLDSVVRFVEDGGDSLELMVHPGHAVREGEWDDFDGHPDRAHELALLSDPALKTHLARLGLRRGSWKDVAPLRSPSWSPVSGRLPDEM